MGKIINDTLVILGNGFDLDLGWETSYSDFYKFAKQGFHLINGMSFVDKMITEEHWYDFEGYLRSCICDIAKEKIEELNLFWIYCRNRIGDYLSRNNIYTKTNPQSCAFRLLTKVSESKVVSFNYTDPFERCGLEDYKILHIHGRLKDIISGAEIKLGVDSSVMKTNDLIKKNSKVRCIVKTNDNANIDTLLTMLKNAKNIIIYGHSLGITDSDYFQPFLKKIVEGRIKDKNIYLVTYNEKSFQNIKDNMVSYGISYLDLLFSKVNFKIIYTSDGTNGSDFIDMINNTSL